MRSPYAVVSKQIRIGLWFQDIARLDMAIYLHCWLYDLGVNYLVKFIVGQFIVIYRLAFGGTNYVAEVDAFDGG